VRAWFERPATLLDLGALAALAFVAVAGYALLGPQAPPGRSPSAAAQPVDALLSPAHVAALLELPAQEATPAGVEIADRPDAALAPGEVVHLRVSLRAPTRVALLHQPPGGPAVQAWPASGQPPALVPRPAAGGPAILPLTLDGSYAEGTHQLRLVVAPVELDLGALAPSALRDAAAGLTLVDITFQVTRI
jgi:hypothetical protein